MFFKFKVSIINMKTLKKISSSAVLIIWFIVIISFSQAATIYGNIYGSDLSLLKYSIVEINSSPKQNIVAIDGNYLFEVPPGTYEIRAVYTGREITLVTKETVFIESEGKFVRDIILFKTDELGDFQDLVFIEKEEDSFNFQGIYLYFALVIFIILLVLVIYLFKKKQKTKVIVRKKTKIIFKRIKSEQKENKTKKEKLEEISHDEILNKIYAIIKKDKRITQKEIRKQIGMSEAKISLVIADLESRGLIKKIKAGRGNIISIIE